MKQLNFSSQFDKKQKRDDPSGYVVHSEFVTSVVPWGKDAAHIRLSLVTRAGCLVMV
jgi:hypothetical protein